MGRACGSPNVGRAHNLMGEHMERSTGGARPARWQEPCKQRRGKATSMRRPVYRLKQALYGHPDAGTYWEEHCGRHVKACGFEPAGPEWPSTYFHPELKLYLIVYVDDFKLCGPDENLAKGLGTAPQGPQH